MFPLLGLLALATAAFTDVVTDLLPAGLLPQMAAGLHVPEARIGLLVSAFAIASAAAAIPMTTVLGKLPRRAVLIGALLGFALCDAATAVSTSYPLTFATRLAAGAMGGTLWSLLAGCAARMVPESQRGRATAIVLSGITVALSLGVPAGTALAAAIGWRACFGTLAGLALTAAAWVRWKVPQLAIRGGARQSGARQDNRPLAATRTALATAGVTRTLLVTLLLLTGHQAMYTYVAPFLAWARFETGPGLVLMVFGVATIGGVFTAGARADRHLRSTLLLTLATIIVAMGALELRATLIAGVVAWGLAYGAAPTLLQTALIKSSGPANADVATALQTTVYNVGIAAGSLLGSTILQAKGTGFLPLGAALLVAGALATQTIQREPEAARKTPARCCP